MAGDYLYYSGRPFKLQEGSWGLVRVYDRGEGGLQPLPGHEDVPSSATSVCPPDAPVRRFAVTAIDVPLPMLDGRTGKAYVLDSQRAALESGSAAPEPLVLHANVGDCIRVTVTNATTSSDITYHCDLLAADPSTSGGVAAGREPRQSVAPGDRGTFTYFASPEVGETVATVRDFGDVVVNPALGLYGAIVIGAAGTRYAGEGWEVDAFPPDGPAYRDATLFFHDGDEAIGSHRMPYTTQPKGAVGINYRTAPIRDLDDPATAFLPGVGPPPTPVINAFAGDPLRIHLLAPWSEQVQVFGLEGHEWSVDPALAGANVVSAVGLGGLESITVQPIGGAGGRDGLPGDYVYGDARGAYREAGMWGLLRVHPRDALVDGLVPLSGTSASGFPWVPVTGAGVLTVALVAAIVRRRRSRV
jgi:hypothetical protein